MFCCFCFVLNSVLSPASAAEYQLYHLYPDHCERLHLRGGPGAGHGRDHVHLPLHVWRVYLPTVHHWSEVTDREMVCFYMVGSGSFKYMIATEAPNSVFTTLLLTIQPLPTPHLQLCRTGIRILSCTFNLKCQQTKLIPSLMHQTSSISTTYPQNIDKPNRNMIKTTNFAELFSLNESVLYFIVDRAILTRPWTFSRAYSCVKTSYK